MHTLSGVRVYWGGGYHDQDAWRCVTRGGRTAYIWATTEIAGDDNLNTPSARTDALELARVVASAKYIG